jgi:hypothetical protein
MSDLGFDWEIKPAAQVRMEVPAGKLEGVGGGSAGLPSASQARVGVKALRRSALGVHFCGGVIGKKGRMCVVSTCDVASHRVNKCLEDVSDGDESDDACLYICCTPEDGSSESSAVFLEPTIRSTRLPDRYLNAVRTVGDWCTLFQSLLDQPNIVTSDEVDELAERTSQPIRRGVMTPRKPNKKAKIETKLDPFGEVDDAVNDAVDDEDVVIPLEPIAEGLGITTESTLAALRAAWEPLLANQYLLQEGLAGRTEEFRTGLNELSSEMEASEVRTTRLEQDVGGRTTESGTQSLFQLVTAADGELDGVLAQIDRVKGDLKVALETSEEDTRKFVLADMGQRLKTSLAPLIGLFGSLSSSKETPGDLLDTRLNQMQAQMTELQTAASRSGSMGFLDDQTKAMHLDARADPQLDQLTETVASMEASLKGMQDQLASELVSVGTVNFISRSFTQNWLTTECGGGDSGQFLYFVDAVSLLSLTQDSGYSAAESVNLEGRLKAAGHNNRAEAVMTHSFEVELPAIFGKEAVSGIMRDDRSLPNLRTYKEWDSGGGSVGAKFILERNLRKCDRIRNNIQNHLSGEAREVARQMLDDSVKFVNELSSWISNHYHEVRNRSGTSEKECWGLISHCVRTVFSELGMARSPGNGPHLEGTKAPSILWGTLQAHRVMRDILSGGFSGYPKLSHVLNLHLQDNTVPRSMFEALQDDVKKANEKIRTLQAGMDKLLSKSFKP